MIRDSFNQKNTGKGNLRPVNFDPAGVNDDRFSEQSNLSAQGRVPEMSLQEFLHSKLPRKSCSESLLKSIRHNIEGFKHIR